MNMVTITHRAYVLVLDDGLDANVPSDVDDVRACALCGREYGGDAMLCLHTHAEHGL